MFILNDKEIPIGLGMALSQNLDAMQVFASLEKAPETMLLSVLTTPSRKMICKILLATYSNSLPKRKLFFYPKA